MFSDYPEILTILAFVALVSVFLFRRNLELKISQSMDAWIDMWWNFGEFE